MPLTGQQWNSQIVHYLGVFNCLEETREKVGQKI